MTLHNALSVATPSQRLAAAAHNERLSRIHGAAALQDAVAAKEADDAQVKMCEPEPVLDHVALIQLWIDRQKQIHQVAADIRADKPLPARPSIGQIQRVCAEHFNFNLAELCSQRRLSPLVRARQIAMYLTKTFTNRSLPEIGRKFGHRDHTTVLHAVRKIETRMQDDADLADDIRTLKRKLERVVA